MKLTKGYLQINSLPSKKGSGQWPAAAGPKRENQVPGAPRKLIGFVWLTPATNRELTAAIPAEAFLP
jgi:hypothetical protein